LEDFERGDAVLEDEFLHQPRNLLAGWVGGQIELPGGGAKRFNRVVRDAPVFWWNLCAGTPEGRKSRKTAKFRARSIELL
jgi:hypothetical protein